MRREVPLKHHVLDKMRDAIQRPGLGARTRAHPDPMETERMCGMGSATTTKPLGSASLSMEIPAGFIVVQIMAQSCAILPLSLVG